MPRQACTAVPYQIQLKCPTDKCGATCSAPLSSGTWLRASCPMPYPDARRYGLTRSVTVRARSCVKSVLLLGSVVVRASACRDHRHCHHSACLVWQHRELRTMRLVEAYKPVCIHNRPCPGALRDTIDPVLRRSDYQYDDRRSAPPAPPPVSFNIRFGHGRWAEI